MLINQIIYFMKQIKKTKKCEFIDIQLYQKDVDYITQKDDI